MIFIKTMKSFNVMGHWVRLMKLCILQVLYEITGSGVYQDFNYDIPNGNRFHSLYHKHWDSLPLIKRRLRRRSCDHQGSGPFNQACVFPFRYQGHTYTECTTAQVINVIDVLSTNIIIVIYHQYLIGQIQGGPAMVFNLYRQQWPAYVRLLGHLCSVGTGRKMTKKLA